MKVDFKELLDSAPQNLAIIDAMGKCRFHVNTHPTQDGSPNRFQRMKETHPRQYDYCMRPLDQKGLGLKEVLEYIGVPYE